VRQKIHNTTFTIIAFSLRLGVIASSHAQKLQIKSWSNGGQYDANSCNTGECGVKRTQMTRRFQTKGRGNRPWSRI